MKCIIFWATLLQPAIAFGNLSAMPWLLLSLHYLALLYVLYESFSLGWSLWKTTSKMLSPRQRLSIIFGNSHAAVRGIRTKWAS